MSKNWTKAGECFCEAANLHARNGSRHDSGIGYADASNCFKKVVLNFMKSWIENGNL